MSCGWIALGCAAQRAGGQSPRFSAAGLDDLDVSDGSVQRAGARLRVQTPEMRAVFRRAFANEAELDFRYLGATHDSARLASGELRQQLGLKLRAQDSCNVVYVMWHVAPSHGIHVSVKHNPGMQRHAQCGDRGYVQVAPSWSRELDPLVPGQQHNLHTRLLGSSLEVAVDATTVWRGSLPADALAFDGPVGIRSDNVDVAFELRVPNSR